MSTALITYLVLHIFFGTSAIILLTAYQLSLNQKGLNFRSLKRSSTAAFVSIILSWVFSGIYYTSYYGKSVKPIILSGQYPWIHKIIMETKEHVFLFLPYLVLVILALTLLTPDEIEDNKKVQKAMMLLCFTIVSIGLAILIGGMMISGAVKK